jgi:hypothetical protein
MHPDFLQAVVDEKRRSVERDARTAHLRRRGASANAVSLDPVVLRLCSVHDDAALARLAALEGRDVPAGRFVLAEVGGAVVAALPLGSGCRAVLADPFRPTAHLLPLLELRAKQLAPDTRRSGALGAWGAVRSWVRA